MAPRAPTGLSRLQWTDYHPAVCRIVAKYNPRHGNYRIHDHEFVEMAFITGGKCLHRSVLGDIRPVAGDVFLLRPGAWHGYEEARHLRLYNCCFDTALLGHELNWMADDPCLGRLLWGAPLSAGGRGMAALHLPPGELAACRRLLDGLAALTERDDTSHYGDRLGILVQILSLLARHLPPGRRGRTHRAVTGALKLLDGAPAEAWTLGRLAASVHVERTYLVRLFRSVVGLPPMAYLVRRRLELATQLLRRDDLTIGEAGARAGWPDANYFSRCFRRQFGMTPGCYRKRFRAMGPEAGDGLRCPSGPVPEARR